MHSAFSLPEPLQRRLNRTVTDFFDARIRPGVDFTRPPGEEALIPADSVSWQIFKNPIALFVGGTAAVILELADPAVCAGIWDHSSFRKDPLGRLRRTGLAAMITVYGARSVAEPMIARVRQMHARVRGTTRAGIRYAADDPRLLVWVHATAAYSFAQAYNTFVAPVSEARLDALYEEGRSTSRLYGALDAPSSVLGMRKLFESMKDQIEATPIIFQFLQIMRETATFPKPLQWLQPILIRAAVEIVPTWMRRRLGLEACGLRAHERWLVKNAGLLANRILLPASPAAQSCQRLDLPANYLYR